MIYELWDLDLGNELAYDESEATMAAMVQSLIARYGDAYADVLDLTIEDKSGTMLRHFSAGALIQWAEEVMSRAADPAEPISTLRQPGRIAAGA